MWTVTLTVPARARRAHGRGAVRGARGRVHAHPHLTATRVGAVVGCAHERRRRSRRRGIAARHRRRPTHDVAVVLGSGWRPAADVIGTPAARARDGRPARLRAAGGRAGTAARSARCASASGGCWCCSAARTCTRGTASSAVAHGVRTAAAAGCRTVVLTNAAGGIRDGMSVGEPVLIRDHLNLTARSPLLGAALRRPHRPLLAAAARAGPRDRPDAGRGRVRRAARAAFRDARRDPDAAHARRRPGGHVDGPGGDRRARGRAWRCSGCRWSRTWPRA